LANEFLSMAREANRQSGQLAALHLAGVEQLIESIRSREWASLG
jgi:hypothetical protein